MNQKNRLLLAQSIGDFIRYWGFRRIHGEIWTLVFLSREPLSGAEIVQQLKVSKALVSPALRELESYELIYQVESVDAKTKRYEANPDVFGVIQQVLRGRESALLKKVKQDFEALGRDSTEELSPERVRALGDMIQSANVFLNALMKMNSPKSLRLLAQLMSKGS